MTIPVRIKGWETPSSVKCLVLDDARNLVPIDCRQDETGAYLLTKAEPGSAVFMLLLEK